MKSLKTSDNAQTASAVLDQLGRPIHDLRISVIDRCNFRCTYCMPEEEYSKHYTFLNKHQWLSFDEIVRVAKIFVSLGVKKIRLTGGEPLLRPHLDDLIAMLNQIKGVEDISLTTNGVFLVEQAHLLKKAGLHRLTVSLDTLDKNVFKKMSGNRGTVDEVLEGIHEAEKAGFKNIKINAVVQKGVNDHTLLDLIEYFRSSGHMVRFIEYMDVGNCNHWDMKHVVPSRDLIKMIESKYPLRKLEANYFGEVSARYEFVDGTGEIGFISSLTQPFCGSCTRARLSTDGKIYTCLFAEKGTDLREALRKNISDEDLHLMARSIWQERGDRYSELRSNLTAQSMQNSKIEMFQIGG